mmetsp:Transcript_8593/g.9577  ORF Transcript_8593/g.9577 Transcript_8593/m.9577 type:complete len:691 (-) Transcript_8593:18-2090(-)
MSISAINKITNVGNVLHKRDAINKISKKLGICILDEWYNVTPQDILLTDDNGVVSNDLRLLIVPLANKNQSNSIAKLLPQVFPKHTWASWRFKSVPSAYWSDESNRRHLVSAIGEKIGVKCLEDWYAKRSGQFYENGGRTLLSQHHGSISALLSTTYPEFEWENWRFINMPLKFWDNKENQMQKIQSVASTLNIKTLDGWYKVESSNLARIAEGLMQKYGKSISKMLQSLFPNYYWEAWKFMRPPNYYWSSVHNQSKLMQSLAEKLNVKILDDWYSVMSRDALNEGGNIILSMYDNAISNAVQAIFPNHRWNISKFDDEMLSGNIHDLTYQRVTMERIAELLNIKNMDSWYNVTSHDIINTGERAIMRKYKNSVSFAMQCIYSHYAWIPGFFKNAHWAENERNRLNDIGQRLGVKVLNDWYRFDANDVIHRGGGDMIKKYGSLKRLLSVTYHTYGWQHKLIPMQPTNRWANTVHQAKFLQTVAASLKITEPSAWYNVSKHQIRTLGGYGILKYYPQALSMLDSEFAWDWTKFHMNQKSNQRYLSRCIQGILPQFSVLEEHCIGLRASTGAPIIVDIFIPKLDIVVEYQGEQHYKDNIFPEGLSTSSRDALDTEKLAICREIGVTVVPIPYWWGDNIDAVIATIRYFCPHVTFDGIKYTGVKPLLELPKSVTEMKTTLMFPKQNTHIAINT